MSLVLKTVWLASLCLCLSCGRSPMTPMMSLKLALMKHQNDVDSEDVATEDYADIIPFFLEDVHPDDIAFFFGPSIGHTPSLSTHRRPYPKSAPVPTRCVPRPRDLRTQRLIVDAYHIGDFDFQVKTRKEYGDWNRSVLAECSLLVGLSDFKKRTLSESRPNECLLSWLKLKTSCRISHIVNGMRDGTGEAEVLVGPLRMLVRVRPESEKFGSPEMHMSEAKEARVIIRDSDGFPTDMTNEINAEIEKTVLCIVNSDVRNVLMDSVKCSWNGSSISCKLMNGNM
ncbi:hypothetical protein JTE90_006798 [Oedothorax gibbosus]|uniref:Uncharacterized protein n=1 Tax=Oedothorax gibbosus TaxID=931172 RepID=A0AAV6VM29_9ARAC|nr:hypothetical protein JTE90_006798 [Oedothorax gibbosus]